MRLQELCRKYDIRLKKKLGQNLLLDDNINRIMVEAAALSKDDDVVEVGAGLGTLTERLATMAGRVLAVEIDPSFMPCLEDRFRGTRNVRLFRGDILNHELGELIDEFLPGGASYKMVSNLPYCITTPVLFHFWESGMFFSCMVVMVQEEVALRMVAPPGSKDYGVLSLAARVYSVADIVHKVPRTCFRPAPDVDSCVVRLRSRGLTPYPDIDAPFLMDVVRAAFSRRRKTLRNALTKSGAFGLPREGLSAALEAAGVDGSRRAETLELEEFARLARELQARRSPHVS